MNRIAPIFMGVALLLVGAAYLNAQVVPAPGPPTAIACAYNSSPPKGSTGNAMWVQCDETGKLITTGGGGGGSSDVTIVSPLGTATAAADSVSVVINGGSALNANGQATMANSTPVVIASNQTLPDACVFRDKSSVAISQTTSTVLVAASASNRIYVCSFAVVAGGAEAISLVSGTGSVCGTSTDAIIGSTTAANGLSLPANGGLTFGNGGGTVAKGPATNEDVCLLQDGSDRVSGVMTYVLAP